MKKWIFCLLLALPSLSFAQFNKSAGGEGAFSVSHLFATFKDRVYQIRVINQATEQKTSIGSGFVLGDGSILATNYHVVSDAIQKDNHRLEFVDEEENAGKLTLLAVDVIHDLAIVKAEKKLAEPFQLGDIPEQGAPLYALGNPHDLGFVIVDGINNGLLKRSAQARILFSGALNGGMSGGPTLNQKGEVVGVNVSYLSRGNNISFIVPSEYLSALLKEASNEHKDLTKLITQQLFSDNTHYYQAALSKKWQEGSIGNFKIPLSMSEDVRCWDASPDSDVDDLVSVESIQCFNDRATFINKDMTIGQLGYSFALFSAREPILTSRFYKIFQQSYKVAFNRRSQRDYKDIECDSSFIHLAGKVFKTTFCRRPSKYSLEAGESIDDVRLVAAQIGEKQEGLLIDILMNGVQTSLSKQVIAHILEQVQWKQ